MARVLERGLRRTVGVPGLFSTAYGNVGSSIYYALGLVAAHALGLTPVVFILAGGLFALTAKTYAEGASMFPEAGGSSSFARHAFNEIASFFAGWALTLDYIITIAISAFFVPHYVGAFFPALRHNPGDIIGGFVVVVVLAALNIRGLRESATLNIFLAITDLLTQIALIVLGAALIFDPSVLVNQVHLGTAPTWHQVVFALSISMVAYTGIETVSNMAEEARDPDEDVPRTVNYVLLAVLGIFAGISIISLVALPVHHVGHHYTTLLGTKYQADPVLGIVSALPLGSGLQHALRYYVGVLAVRYKDPDRHRPYRVPWNIRFRGGWLPLSAVLGGIGTFAAWLSVVILKPEARLVGIPWMVIGLSGYLLYRRHIGVDPREQCRIERPKAPEGFHELAYGSALVPLFGTDVSGSAMSSAARLAGEDATVDALYVIDVPPQLSLDAGMEAEEDQARAVLDIARLRGRERKLKVRTSMIRTRNPGAALVEEARRRGSEVIYLDTVHAPPSERVLGPTALYLLRERPCRIVVETDNRLRQGVNGRPDG